VYNLTGTLPRLLVLLGFCLVIGGLAALGGLALVKPLYGLSIEDISSLKSNLDDPQNVAILKFLQLLNTLGLFVIPALAFVFLFEKKPVKTLHLNHLITPINAVMVFILMLCSIPSINWLVEWNKSINLPEQFEAIENWMKQAEDRAMGLTKAFLRMDSPSALWQNLLLVAVLPAIGEEMIFRGIVQQNINRSFKTAHLGIWISAILFSALHMQFYGFFPRMFLGAFFGYLLVWTKNLWVPILAHFINNALAVLIAYQLGIEGMEAQFDQLGASRETSWFSLVGLVLFIGLLFVFYRSNSWNRIKRA
jgi:membrane protease YdiL (CAAX protease family)